MTNAIDIVVNAEKEIGQLDIQNKAFIVSLLMSARRNVAMQLASANIEGFQGALDTMEKVKAVEDYIKRRRGQSRAELVTQNTVATERLRIVRDIGKWLEKYLYNGRPKEKIASDSNLFEEIKYKLDDLSITEHQSSDWQIAARGEDEEFDKWVSKFLDTAMEREDELTLSKYLSYVRPKSENHNELLSEEERYRKYYQEFAKLMGEGKISRDEFIKRKDEWIKTQKANETIMRQGGELY